MRRAVPDDNCAGPGRGERADLAKEVQNPVAALISVPFQNNTNFGIGPFDRTQNILNIQPVWPFNVGEWNIITRTIAPLIRQPDFASDTGSKFGLGDINSLLLTGPAGDVLTRFRAVYFD